MILIACFVVLRVTSGKTYVQQETAHELLGGKRHRLVAGAPLGSVVLPG
jgi:hypothetical protein